MCASRSIYPWDIIIDKQDDKIYLDKRDGGYFDILSVNENANQPPVASNIPDKESINSPSSLGFEATIINRNYSQQILNKDESMTFKNKNPFTSVAESPSIAYRYRKWNLGDEISLIVRTHLDAAVFQSGLAESRCEDEMEPLSSDKNQSETLFANVKCLNEFDPKAIGSGGLFIYLYLGAPDWRTKLDFQRGAVFAAELKNNGCKLSKWTVETLLSGADQLKIGFVTRCSIKDRKRHVIVGSTTYKPADLVDQLNINVGNLWGVVRAIVDLVFEKCLNGKYILAKDPNKVLLFLIKRIFFVFIKSQTALLNNYWKKMGKMLMKTKKKKKKKKKKM